MKKCSVLVATVLACMTLLPSCMVGSFSALNWCFNFNTNLTPNKYINAVVGAILSPFEFMIGGFLDAIIFNTVEFWSGSNPMDELTRIEGANGHHYLISPDQSGGYLITDETTGQQLALLLDRETRTWTVEFEGVSQKVITLLDERNAVIYNLQGDAMSITLDDAGLMACQQWCAIGMEQVALR